MAMMLAQKRKFMILMILMIIFSFHTSGTPAQGPACHVSSTYSSNPFSFKD
jgi:hypothetical protein